MLKCSCQEQNVILSDKGGAQMLGEYLKKYRIENGLTQADLAGKLSISQNAISQYENGKRCPPISRIAKIAKVLGCSVGDIVSDSDT